MKFASIVTFELRALKKTIDKLYHYIFDYYDTDIFIICQKKFENDDELLKLFNRRVKLIHIYEKPNPNEYFGENSNINVGYYNEASNWKFPGCLQMYINYNEVAKLMREYCKDYDYFINFRVDIDILFNFPPPDFFNNIPKGVYSHIPYYACYGSGLINFIHTSIFIECFTSFFDFIVNNENKYLLEQNGMINQEIFLTMSLENKKIKIIPIKTMNFYYTAENINDYTTWGTIHINPNHNVLCKYTEQCNEAFDGLSLWNQGYRWAFIDNTVKLNI